jgi:hypothetical protein
LTVPLGGACFLDETFYTQPVRLTETKQAFGPQIPGLSTGTKQSMGKTKIALPFGGCASSEPSEVRMPKLWIPGLCLALGLIITLVIWTLS